MNCYKCATPLPDHSKFCMACGADVSGEGHTHNTLNLEPDPELLAALQTELGKEFVVERELGRGGMAIVYLGQDTHLGRKVAIKLLPPVLTFGSGPGFIERFKREARMAATLDHPNIIPVYRVSTGGKLFWYVMKYLPGESLDVLLKREGAFEVDRAIEILSQAADALDYAHQNSVVHRDVKPANIMIDKRGRVTVTDFGIAKAMETTGLTNSGATIGTPHYMSPEQCLGVGVTGASDQYALAVSAYQMFSGHLPFAAESVLELMRMHTADPPPPLGTLRPTIPPGVVAAVERGLAKSVQERFPTCADFVAELSRAAKESATLARRPTATATEAPVVKGGRAEVKVASTPLPIATPTAPHIRRIATVGGGFAAFLIAAIVVLIILDQVFRPGAGKSVDPPSARSTRAGALTDSSRATSESTKVTSAGAERAPEPPPVPTAQLELRGVPAGATITRNGERVPGTTFEIAPGKPSAVEVSMTGFIPWRRTLTPDTGQRLVETVTLQAAPVQRRGEQRLADGSTKTGNQPSPATKSAPARTDLVMAPGDDSTRPVAAAPATLTVASRPPSAISINGRAAPTHPVINYQVPSGRVAIRFQVTDSTGVWTVDTVITLAPGEIRNLGRIPLKRP